jgi:hypothetical protein
VPKYTHRPLPLPKHWPRCVRSAAVHAIALARLALTTARYPAGTTFTGTGLSPAGTTNLSRHTWTTTPVEILPLHLLMIWQTSLLAVDTFIGSDGRVDDATASAVPNSK